MMARRGCHNMASGHLWILIIEDEFLLALEQKRFRECGLNLVTAESESQAFVSGTSRACRALSSAGRVDCSLPRSITPAGPLKDGRCGARSAPRENGNF